MDKLGIVRVNGKNYNRALSAMAWSQLSLKEQRGHFSAPNFELLELPLGQPMLLHEALRLSNFPHLNMRWPTSRSKSCRLSSKASSLLDIMA